MLMKCWVISIPYLIKYPYTKIQIHSHKQTRVYVNSYKFKQSSDWVPYTTFSLSLFFFVCFFILFLLNSLRPVCKSIYYGSHIHVISYKQCSFVLLFFSSFLLFCCCRIIFLGWFWFAIFSSLCNVTISSSCIWKFYN